MKKGIHPELHDVQAICSCGFSFSTTSSEPVVKTTLCSQCHPFYTGQSKFVDTAGRIEKFANKYKNVQVQTNKKKK